MGWIWQRGAQKVWSRCRRCAASHRKGSSFVMFLSTKIWFEVRRKLLEVRLLVAPGHLLGLHVLHASLKTMFLLVLCWYGQTHLRLVTLPCSVLLQPSQTGSSVLLLSKLYMLLETASGEVAVWLVSHRVLILHKLMWNLHLFTFWKSVLLNAHLRFWGLTGTRRWIWCWITFREALEALNPVVCELLAHLGSRWLRSVSCDQ